MTLASRISQRSIALAALLLVAPLAAPAFAGNRGAGGGCDDPQPGSKSGSGVEGKSSATSSAGRRESTSPSPTEDGYLPLSRAPQPSAPAALKPAESPAAPASAPRVEKPKPATARKAEAPAASNRAKKPAPAPAKMSIPNLPARPGMGTLLRVGITAGREIS